MEDIQLMIKLIQEADSADGNLEIFWEYEVLGGPVVPNFVYNDAPNVSKSIIKTKVTPSSQAIARRLHIGATDAGAYLTRSDL